MGDLLDAKQAVNQAKNVSPVPREANLKSFRGSMLVDQGAGRPGQKLVTEVVLAAARAQGRLEAYRVLRSQKPLKALVWSDMPEPMHWLLMPNNDHTSALVVF